MEEKKTPWFYKVICGTVKALSPKYEITGAENLPDEPYVIVSNHCQMYGPIAGELYMPGKHYVWCSGEMMNKEEVAAYAYKDFWSGKPKSVRWFYKILSHLITPVCVFIFNNAHTVAVYHDSRLISTFRDSIAKLQGGANIVIFPEHYTERNNIVYDFQDKFVDLARLYYKKTGVELDFVPMYIAPKIGKIVFGTPVKFRSGVPIGEERARICEYLMDAITDMAVALPEHTVVPYPNISKKDYPKNIPLEVYVNENKNAAG